MFSGKSQEKPDEERKFTANKKHRAVLQEARGPPDSQVQLLCGALGQVVVLLRQRAEMLLLQLSLAL